MTHKLHNLGLQIPAAVHHTSLRVNFGSYMYLSNASVTQSILLKQSVICAILLKQFYSVCGVKVASNFASLSESKISNAFHIFWHSCHFAHPLPRRKQFGSLTFGITQFCLSVWVQNAWASNYTWVLKGFERGRWNDYRCVLNSH